MKQANTISSKLFLSCSATKQPMLTEDSAQPTRKCMRWQCLLGSVRQDFTIWGKESSICTTYVPGSIIKYRLPILVLEIRFRFVFSLMWDSQNSCNPWEFDTDTHTIYFTPLSIGRVVHICTHTTYCSRLACCKLSTADRMVMIKHILQFLIVMIESYSHKRNV